MTTRHRQPSARAVSISALHSRSCVSTASPSSQRDTVTLCGATSRQLQPSGPEVMVQRLTSSPRCRVTSSSAAPGGKSVSLDGSADAPPIMSLSFGRSPIRADLSRRSRRRSRFGRAWGSASSRAVTSPQSSHFSHRTTTFGESHDGQAKDSITANAIAIRVPYSLALKNRKN